MRPRPGPRFVLLFVGALVCGAGCRSEAPDELERPPPAAPQPLPPPPLEPIAPLQRGAQPFGGRSGPRVNDAIRKRLWVRLCGLGTTGLEVVREAYWESLGPDVPSPGHIPSFGEYPEYQRKGVAGEPPLAKRMGRLPFDRYLRACGRAKLIKTPAYPELDKALAELEAYLKPLLKTVSDASRYYARQEYQRDSFKKAEAFHESISDGYGAFDRAVGTYRRALSVWRQDFDLEKLAVSERLTAAGGAAPSEAAEAAPIRSAPKVARLSARAVIAAEAIGRLVLMSKPGDPALAGRLSASLPALAKVRGQLERYGKSHPKAIHSRLVLPALDALLALLRARPAGRTNLNAMDRYRLAVATAAVLDADHRALLHHLRGGKDAFGGLGAWSATPLLSRSATPRSSRSLAPQKRPLRSKRPKGSKGQPPGAGAASSAK